MNVFFLIHLLTSYHLKFLKCFRSNSTPKANSRGESYPSLIYSNPSLTPTKNKIKLEYINEGQPSPLKLDFGIELGLKHFRNSRFVKKKTFYFFIKKIVYTGGYILRI